MTFKAHTEAQHAVGKPLATRKNLPVRIHLREQTVTHTLSNRDAVELVNLFIVVILIILKLIKLYQKLILLLLSCSMKL